MATLAALWLAGVFAATRFASRLRQSEAECARLRIERLMPQTQPEMVTAAETTLAEARNRLATARSRWPAPVRSDDAVDRLAVYGEVRGLVERHRLAAGEVGAAVGKDEYFGFHREAGAAPERAESAVVIAQLRTVDRVLRVLWATRPTQLLGVEREEGPANGSRWLLDPNRSVRVPGLVDSHVVRVAYAGNTATLRSFLAGLHAEPGLVAREVEVAAEPAPERGPPLARMASDGRRLVVTVEAVTLVGGALEPREGATAQAVRWRARANGGLFDPPEMVYDKSAQRWRPAPGAGTPAEEFALALVAVRREPPPWRLVGHVNTGPSDAVLCEEVATRRSILLRPGECDRASGLELKTLAISTGRQGARVIAATLADPRRRELLRLTTEGGEAQPLCAVLRVRGRAEPLVVAPGAAVAVAGTDYRVEAISEQPAAVELAWRDGEAAWCRRRLLSSPQ